MKINKTTIAVSKCGAGIVAVLLASSTFAVGQVYQYDYTKIALPWPDQRAELESRLESRIASGGLSPNEIASERANIEKREHWHSAGGVVRGKFAIFANDSEMSLLEDIGGPESDGVYRVIEWSNFAMTVEAPLSRATEEFFPQGSYHGSFRILNRHSLLPCLLYALSGQITPGYTLESVSADGKSATYARVRPELGRDPVGNYEKYLMQVVYADGSRTQPRKIEFSGLTGKLWTSWEVEGTLGQPGFKATRRVHDFQPASKKIFEFAGMGTSYFEPSDIAIGSRMAVFKDHRLYHEYEWNGRFEEAPVVSLPVYAWYFMGGLFAIGLGLWVLRKK